MATATAIVALSQTQRESFNDIFLEHLQVTESKGEVGFPNSASNKLKAFDLLEVAQFCYWGFIKLLIRTFIVCAGHAPRRGSGHIGGSS